MPPYPKSPETQRGGAKGNTLAYAALWDEDVQPFEEARNGHRTEGPMSTKGW